MSTRHVRIDLDRILDTALTGVRRTAAFLGLGMNAAANPNLTNYSLTSVSVVQLIPPDLGPEKVADFKSHFSKWIVTCGLRELIETFGVFLDQIYEVCLYTMMSKEEPFPSDPKKLYGDFERNGIEAKLKCLEDNFGIKPRFPGHFGTIQKVRNCLAHRRGIVGPKDVDALSVLELKWRGIDFVITGSEGELARFNSPLTEPILVEEGGSVGIRVVDRHFEFPLASVVEIPPRDLAEICLFITWEAGETINSVKRYLESKGIQVMTKPKQTSADDKKTANNA